MDSRDFKTIPLDDSCHILLGRLPERFDFNAERFRQIWDTHPANYHIVRIMGKDIPTPRWQQAYGKNYRYTGAKQNALPVPDILLPYLDWCQAEIAPTLNGLLLNWYEGRSKHYIGAHKDDTRDLLEGSPIVTISLGEERVFRMRPWKKRGYKDYVVGHGSILVIPWDTNQHWTHEVPHFARYEGRRISITSRAFL